MLAFMTAQYHLAVVAYDYSVGALLTRACGDVKVCVVISCVCVCEREREKQLPPAWSGWPQPPHRLFTL